MNVIIYFQTELKNNLPGSFFDSLEYFLFAQQYNKELEYYIFIDKKSIKQKILDVIKYRYIPININWDKFHIVHYNYYKREFILKKIKKLFFFDMISLKFLKYMIPNVEKIYYITELTYPESFKLHYKRTIYCSEMPFCYADKKIKLKFFFDIYKNFNEIKNNILVSYPNGDLEEVKDIIGNIKKPILEKNNNFFPDIHKHFNEYLYIKSPYWFDTHPRLFHECYFYGKKYHYINTLRIKDGSWYRYYDLQENGLKDRIMNKDDWLIQEMIN
jgi:hypothetical protein